MAKLYTLVPRPVGRFEGVDLMARCVFGLIYDRWQLSDRSDESRRKYSDEDGVYCYFDREEMAKELGVTLPTVRRAVTTLINRKLLIIKRSGVCSPWRYYVPWRLARDLDPRKHEQYYEESLISI